MCAYVYIEVCKYTELHIQIYGFVHVFIVVCTCIYIGINAYTKLIYIIINLSLSLHEIVCEEFLVIYSIIPVKTMTGNYGSEYWPILLLLTRTLLGET